MSKQKTLFHAPPKKRNFPIRIQICHHFLLPSPRRLEVSVQGPMKHKALFLVSALSQKGFTLLRALREVWRSLDSYNIHRDIPSQLQYDPFLLKKERLPGQCKSSIYFGVTSPIISHADDNTFYRKYCQRDRNGAAHLNLIKVRRIS